MKTLREYIDILDEISRRDALKYAGAAAAGAVVGSPKDAEADRSWSVDPISDKWSAVMTSENFPGATLFWDEDIPTFQIEFRQPSNWSPAAVKEKRLHFPQVTSYRYTLRFGNNEPINGGGLPSSFPARQFGNYKSGAFIITQDKTRMARMRDAFINADKVAIRLEIDGMPKTIVFYDNPDLLKQRQAKQQPQSSQDDVDKDLADIRQKLQSIDRSRSQKESQAIEESEPEDPIQKIDRLFR